MSKENVKTEADNLTKLSAYYLNKNGFFQGLVIGDIPAICGGAKNGYHIIVSTLNKDAPYVYLSYSILQPNGEHKDYGYYVDLASTACHYGGKRYWFLCPITIDGKPCGKRVAVLYLGGNVFGCSGCYSLTYRSRKLSGIYKKFGVINMPEMERQGLDFKRWHYKGKPTKKFLRFIKKYEKAMVLAKAFNEQGDNRLKKLQKKVGLILKHEQE